MYTREAEADLSSLTGVHDDLTPHLFLFVVMLLRSVYNTVHKVHEFPTPLARIEMTTHRIASRAFGYLPLPSRQDVQAVEYPGGTTRRRKGPTSTARPPLAAVQRW
jgi:hypothetical protein